MIKSKMQYVDLVVQKRNIDEWCKQEYDRKKGRAMIQTLKLDLSNEFCKTTTAYSSC